MAKSNFSLADAIGLQSVSGSDTGREQIEYIDIGLIDGDDRNFYELSGVGELAGNIELLGLQQPIRVRPGEGERVIIVSGHRRRAALQQLVDEGKEQFRAVPCIRETTADSDALQELRLIFANSSTRDLTSAEISKQAERVEVLLYELKEQGMEFPGRMRDHVAEACKVSASKLARLKVIRENLSSRWMPFFEKGKIRESTAYALAQMPKSWQGLILDARMDGKSAHYTYEQTVKNIGTHFERISALECKHCPGGGKCGNAVDMMQKCAKLDSYCSVPCGRVCCADCGDLLSCKTACTMEAVQKKKKKLQQERKDRNASAKAAQEERDRPQVERLADLWERFGKARSMTGKTAHELAKAADLHYIGCLQDETAVMQLECREKKPAANEYLPYGYKFSLGNLNAIVKMADALDVSIDYLFGRTDAMHPNGAAPAGAPRWQTGTPERDGNYWCRLGCDGVTIRAHAYYDAFSGKWLMRKYGEGIGAEVVAWYPLPDDKEDDDDD